MSLNEILIFGSFLVLVAAMLTIDLGVFQKRKHIVKPGEAAIWSLVWVSLALLSALAIRFYGHLLHNPLTEVDLSQLQAKFHPQLKLSGDFNAKLSQYDGNLALEFVTGWLLEYALSVDNIFVMILIFQSFAVEEQYYKKILLWGILGAVVLRFIFIFVGSALIEQFEWTLYLFGAFLIFAGGKILFGGGDEDKVIDTSRHPVVRFASKHLSVTPVPVKDRFFVKLQGKWYVTPIFLVLLIIEGTDVVFAVDSVPAVFSVTQDPYIVFFSNVFAILGLRSMFFLLVHVMHKFHYLQVGLGVLLVFIGVKMLAHHWMLEWGFGTTQSLLTIVGILVLSVVASLLFPKPVAGAVDN